MRRSSLHLPSDDEEHHYKYKREPYSRPGTPPATFHHQHHQASPRHASYSDVIVPQQYRPRSRTPTPTPTHHHQHRIASVIQERYIKEERPPRRSSIDEDQQVAQYYRDHPEQALRYTRPEEDEEEVEYARRYHARYEANPDEEEEDEQYRRQRRRLSEERRRRDEDSDFSDSQVGGAVSGDTDHYPKSEEEPEEDDEDDERPLDLSMKIKRRIRKDSAGSCDSDDSAGPDSDGNPRGQGRAAYKKSLMKRYRKSQCASTLFFLALL